MPLQNRPTSATRARAEGPEMSSSSYANDWYSVDFMDNKIFFPGFQVGEQSFDELVIEIPGTIKMAEDFYEVIKDTIPKSNEVQSGYFTFDQQYEVFETADEAESAVLSRGYRRHEYIIRTLLP
jgi:hypothetical protein